MLDSTCDKLCFCVPYRFMFLFVCCFFSVNTVLFSRLPSSVLGKPKSITHLTLRASFLSATNVRLDL